jgi:hypothetical protein
MLDEGPGVSDDSACRAADVRIHLENLFDWLRNDESGVESSFHGEDDTLSALDADGWWAELHGNGGTLMASIAYSTWKMRP